MWERFRRYRALPPIARELFRRAAVLLPILTMSLRLRGLQATQAMLKRRVTSGIPEAAPAEMRERTGWTVRMVNAASRYTVGHATCLERSLAIWWLLARQGVASDLRIGVRKSGDHFEAHAWVEQQTAPLHMAETDHEHYAAFDASFSSLPTERT